MNMHEENQKRIKKRKKKREVLKYKNFEGIFLYKAIQLLARRKKKMAVYIHFTNQNQPKNFIAKKNK